MPETWIAPVIVASLVILPYALLILAGFFGGDDDSEGTY